MSDLAGPDGGDAVGELVQRAVLTYAVRAILLQHSQAVWRMGEGHPIPYELLTGADNVDIMVAAVGVLRELIEEYQKFVFISREPRERTLLALGEGLHSGEFVIVQKVDRQLKSWFHQKRFTAEVGAGLEWDGEPLSPAEWIPRFVEEVAPEGCGWTVQSEPLRAGSTVLCARGPRRCCRSHRAWPTRCSKPNAAGRCSLDLARQVSKVAFSDSMMHLTQTAYTAAGQPWRCQRDGDFAMGESDRFAPASDSRCGACGRRVAG